MCDCSLSTGKGEESRTQGWRRAWKVQQQVVFIPGCKTSQGERRFYLLHLEEVLDGRNVAGTFRPPVVLHILADLRTNTGCSRSHSDQEEEKNKELHKAGAAI